VIAMSEKSGVIIARAEAQMEIAHYACTIRTGRHSLIADEAKSAGGADAGPSPFGLLLSSLGACTAITLRMYADRKHWPLAEIGVSLSYRSEGETPRIERTIRLDGLDEEQRRRCLEIAEKTPVTRALKGVAIATRLQ
jgi:putative redox protein